MSTQTNDKCPLCIAPLDLTDKQLKPCKCGYEVNFHRSSTILVCKQFVFHFLLLIFILYLHVFNTF
jgi:hypothetical protein